VRMPSPVTNPLMRVTAAVLLMTQLSACASEWKRTFSVPAPRTEPPWETVRFTLLDSSQVEILNPAVVDDSVIGTSASELVRLAIPLNQIGIMEQLKNKSYEWEFLGLVVAVILAVVLYRTLQDLCEGLSGEPSNC